MNGKLLTVALVPAVFLATPALAGAPRPIVVELYTSQGCSSCPPADALLGTLVHHPDVIAMTLPVTYWDMLGWKDTLAREANTQRQKAYAKAMGRGGVYTPQIIVDGAIDVVGSRADKVEDAIDAAKNLRDAADEVADALHDAAKETEDALREAGEDFIGHQVALRMTAASNNVPARHLVSVPVDAVEMPQQMRITVGGFTQKLAAGKGATVWLFHLRSTATVKVGAGENAGHTMTYRNVAGDVRAVGQWNGQPLSVDLPRAGMEGLPHDGVAVVVQEGGYGRVIGAAYLSHPDYYAEE